MKRYDYYTSRQLVNMTGVIFWSQVILQVLGIIERKPEFDFILPLCGIIWIASIVYAITLVVLNASIRNKNNKKQYKKKNNGTTN